ncbi:MAG: CorA family divalent cation transporter, partial [Limnobacter sp.]|nr:CorA family divalent cation transporter [Limnobacter sp.]
MINWFHFKGTEITALDGAPPSMPEQGFLWVDSLLNEENLWLDDIQRLAGITVDELHLEDLRNHHHPSHFDSGQRYSILIIRSLSGSELVDEDNKLKIKTRPAFFLVADRILVTMRSPDSRTFESARNFIHQCIQAGGQVKIKRTAVAQLFKLKRAPSTPEELQIQIVGGLVDRYLEMRHEISSQLDNWQRDLLNSRKRFQDWNALLSARNELTRLESVAEDQTDALGDWLDYKDRKNKADQAVLVKARDTLEHLERVSNLARRLGESTEAAVQLHFSATAHKTNEVITMLTMLSAVFMPL